MKGRRKRERRLWIYTQRRVRRLMRLNNPWGVSQNGHKRNKSR
jgi:hypothetical protein